MLPSNPLFDKKNAAAVRYWLGWLLLLVALAAAMHGYLDYRNRELDKRLHREDGKQNQQTSSNE